jgi:hypothetical protein
MSNDAHARPSGEADILYDPDVPTPTHGERARTLVSNIKTGTLCTLAQEPAGFPYGSFVTFSLDSGDPIFFISTMAEHTKNLLLDGRASLLVAESGGADPLAGGRVTLLGEARQLVADEDRANARASYLAIHPNASYYIDFGDFSFWKLEVASLRYIGGYGRMSWVSLEDWRGATPDPTAAFADGVIEHMNEDHAEAMVAYCHAFSRATDASAATMTGLDRYGFEMSAETGQGPRPIRLPFAEEIRSADGARQEMIRLLKLARHQLAAGEGEGA